MAVTCPRCHKAISGSPGEQGFLDCPGCGARLRLKPPPGASVPRESAAKEPAGSVPPSFGSVEVVQALRDLGHEMAGIGRTLSGIHETLKSLPAPSGPGAPGAADTDAAFPGMESGGEPQAPPPVRTRRRRKKVLLVDDDEGSLAEAQAALHAAEVPVQVVSDGNRAISAIAAEKPDVIVLELDLRGPMAGKDVINMIKATMEWVDIPIVLYTRAEIASQKEARQIHGADELVPKIPGAAQTMVDRVIQIFQRPAG